MYHITYNNFVQLENAFLEITAERRWIICPSPFADSCIWNRLIQDCELIIYIYIRNTHGS